MLNGRVVVKPNYVNGNCELIKYNVRYKCTCPDAHYEEDTFYERKKVKLEPEILNRDNKCIFYKNKNEDS